MQKRVLIVTNVHDIHADIVERKLRDRNARPFRINLDEFPRDFSIDLGFGPDGIEGGLRHLPSGDALALADVGAAWLRKTARFEFISGDLAAQEQAFAEAETEHLFFSLLHSLDCFWMSHPRATRAALWKGEQLRRASRMGFSVPRSLIANDPDAVRGFRDRLGRDLIFKTMSSPSLCAEDVAAADRRYYGLPTTLMSEQHFAALDAVREVPCLFQEHIPKRHELRVTVIGQRAFAARIQSQQDQRTATDYREFSVEIPYEAEKLSPEIESRCIAFVRSYGLEFGAIDLIVTPQDELVFLENNPGGQFLFVEQLVPELKMTDAVADLLAQAAAREWRSADPDLHRAA
jgi:glutathione synthase/RimK-type ligase-like ATP-grasp enzyme